MACGPCLRQGRSEIVWNSVAVGGLDVGSSGAPPGLLYDPPGCLKAQRSISVTVSGGMRPLQSTKNLLGREGEREQLNTCTVLALKRDFCIAALAAGRTFAPVRLQLFCSASPYSKTLFPGNADTDGSNPRGKVCLPCNEPAPRCCRSRPPRGTGAV